MLLSNLLYHEFLGLNWTISQWLPGWYLEILNAFVAMEKQLRKSAKIAYRTCVFLWDFKTDMEYFLFHIGVYEASWEAQLLWFKPLQPKRLCTSLRIEQSNDCCPIRCARKSLVNFENLAIYYFSRWAMDPIGNTGCDQPVFCSWNINMIPLVSKKLTLVMSLIPRHVVHWEGK